MVLHITKVHWDDLVNSRTRSLLTFWLIIVDYSRVDVLLVGDDPGADDGPDDEVEYPFRDWVYLARREKPLVSHSALAQLRGEISKSPKSRVVNGYVVKIILARLMSNSIKK